MGRIYVVHHSHQIDGDSEDVKLIGCFSSKTRAEEAVKRLSVQPGFSGSAVGFTIEGYEIDVDHWTQGFVTVRD